MHADDVDEEHSEGDGGDNDNGEVE